MTHLLRHIVSLERNIGSFAPKGFFAPKGGMFNRIYPMVLCR